MTHLRAHLFTILNESPSAMTVRQVFYQAVSRGVIDKTEGEYKSTIVRLLTEMRLDGLIPFGWIADNTRWQRKPRTFSTMESALERTAQTYRRQLWDNQDAYVEVWLEKEALAGVVYDITAEFDVPLMVTRGYPSLSFLHEAAETMDAAAGVRTDEQLMAMSDEERRQLVEDCNASGRDLTEGKDVFVYYFGDHDPSGVDIARSTEERLDEFAQSFITFERVAVTEEQIRELDLPTRPTKRTDSRAAGWDGGSVEARRHPRRGAARHGPRLHRAPRRPGPAGPSADGRGRGAQGAGAAVQPQLRRPRTP
jgi:hypothetical protein